MSRLLEVAVAKRSSRAPWGVGRGRPFRLALPVLAGAEKGGQGTRARGAASGSGGDGEEGKGKSEK